MIFNFIFIPTRNLVFILTNKYLEIMNTYIVKTNRGTFHVEAWNESKVTDLMSYEGYEVISINLINN